MFRRYWIAAFLAASMVAGPVAWADEFTDTLDTVISAYKAGEYGVARENLDYATQLLREKGAEQISSVLPDAVPGWTAQDIDTDQSMAGLFGGGMSVSRSYTHDNGASVSVSVVGDSPLLAQFMMLLGNPALAGSMGKAVRFGKYRGILNKEGTEISVVVDNRFMVSVQGSGGATQDDLMEFAKQVDLDALAAI